MIVVSLDMIIPEYYEDALPFSGSALTVTAQELLAAIAVGTVRQLGLLYIILG